MCFLLILSHHQVLDTRYPLLVARYSILDTRDKLENTLEVFISFRRCVHNFQMAKFESWQAAIERLIANYKLALHCPGQSSPVSVQREADSIKLWLHAFD